jgi:hypothetical protein
MLLATRMALYPRLLNGANAMADAALAAVITNASADNPTLV